MSKKELTVGTLAGNEKCPSGWVAVHCQFCGREMYCQEMNSKPKPGWELVLSCHECLAAIESDSMNEIRMEMKCEPDPWEENFRWN